MPRAKQTDRVRLPKGFEALVQVMAPRAISDDVQHENTLEMIDRLMASGRLTKGQAAYLETLVQLVEAYEAQHHAIDIDGLDGIATLRHLLDQSDMNASDLARLLELHPSMGSKILNGDRSLTVGHVRALAEHFGVRPDVLIA